MPTAYNINPTPFGNQTAGADPADQEVQSLKEQMARAGLTPEELNALRLITTASGSPEAAAVRDVATSAKAKLMRSLGLTDDEAGNAAFSQYLQRHAQTIATGDLSPTPAAQPANARAAQQMDTTAQIKDFIARMSAPVVDAQGRITDPILKQLATIGYNGGMNAAGDRGIAGGAASSQAAAMAQQTGLPYLQQRQSLAAQGLGLLNNNTLTSEQLAQNAYGLNLQAQGLNNQLALGQYGQQVQGAQGVGSIIGGGLGALVGGLATAGNPAGIGAGLTAGASIGGGIAGQAIAPPKLGSFKPYSAS